MPHAPRVLSALFYHDNELALVHLQGAGLVLTTSGELSNSGLCNQVVQFVYCLTGSRRGVS